MAGIYLHIPFCRHKCAYCDFFSSVSLSNKSEYLIALQQEIRLQSNYFEGESISSIYFGGGTPSLLEPHEIHQLLNYIFEEFSVIDFPEITMEANPEDINYDWICGIRETQVNRISLGVQSFDSSVLQHIGRKHTAEKSFNSIQLLLDEGYNNITADLIYGIPGQTDDILKKDINTLIEFNIPHISAYALTVEEKTLLHRQIKQGKLSPPDENQMADQFYLIKDSLAQMGYEHYEISNYCLPSHQAKHNVSYWTGEKYLGLGASAHSYDGKIRKWNVSSIKEYIQSLQKGKILCESEEISPIMRHNEYILTHLRTKWGVKLA